MIEPEGQAEAPQLGRDEADGPQTGFDRPHPGVDQVDRPHTGVDQVDDALTELDGIADLPVAEHHDRLARVHEALHTVLHQPADRPDEPADGSA